MSASYSRGSTTFAVAVAFVIVALTASPANAASAAVTVLGHGGSSPHGNLSQLSAKPLMR